MLWRRHHRYVNGYWVGVYELPLQETIHRELRPGQTFFDIGANAGFFTLVAALTVGPSGKCVAFEPLPENAESVREQVELNGLAHCHLVQEAVTNRSGLADFSFDTVGDSQAHIGSSGNSIQVRATTLD
ncbi:MAG: FkbM family methyltransferase, partial [Candidatus Sumerlaeaceae bacterium]|nr:FkbM family methyltransferase [Candidatus Sumerlaeaceae bacterium]